MSCLIGTWGSKLVQTDIQDPANGEALYVYAKVRPRWFWQLRTVQLFLGIVWRDAWGGGRLDATTAWSVARGLYSDAWGRDERLPQRLSLRATRAFTRRRSKEEK